MIKVLYDKLESKCDNELIWKPNNTETYNMFTQHIKYVEPIVKEIENEDNEIKKSSKKKSQKKKEELIKPIELIVRETNSFPDFANEIKDKLIKFISQKEFNKVFGATKNSEIMTGIVNNKWNKSTALFVSFILSKIINYNGAMITYNKEKYTETLELTI